MELKLRAIHLSSLRNRTVSRRNAWGRDDWANIFIRLEDGTFGFRLYGTDVDYVTRTGYPTLEAAEAAALEYYDNECGGESQGEGC
jgi:hypothetical protein